MLNIGTTDETFKKSGEQDSFRHLLESGSTYDGTYDSSGSQFFRITTGIPMANQGLIWTF